MNRNHLIAAALLIATAAPVRAQSVRAGIDAWQRSDYAGAVAIWRPLADKGDADAEFNLGQAYRLGRGVPIDLAAAKTWFERAANQGHVDAETTLGLLLFQNADRDEGLGWLKKAADMDEPRALLVYGTALVNGDGVTQDPVLGYAYVSRAAAQGLGPAKETLKQLDQLLPVADRKRGVGIARELAKAAPAPTSASEAATKPAKSARAKSRSKRTETAPAKPVETASSEPVAPPKSKAAGTPEASPKAQASGDWRIQLGAFSKKASAEELYRKLSGKAALAGREPFYVPAGPVTRLQAGPFESSTAAEAACKAVGVACFPVRAK